MYSSGCVKNRLPIRAESFRSAFIVLTSSAKELKLLPEKFEYFHSSVQIISN